MRLWDQGGVHGGHRREIREAAAFVNRVGQCAAKEIHVVSEDHYEVDLGRIGGRRCGVIALDRTHPTPPGYRKAYRLLRTAGAEVAYHDPHVPEFDGMRSVPLEPESYHCVAIVTAHSAVDYADVVRRAKVVVDFRNATKQVDGQGKVWKL